MTDGDNPKSRVRQMLTAEHVLALIPVSRSTLFRLERDRLFPQGQAITPHRKLWFEHQVIAWQEALLDPNSALSQALSACDSAELGSSQASCHAITRCSNQS